MALERIETPPAIEAFTLLSEHQEQTPGTFFGGKPVLHLHSPGAKVRISKEDLESQPGTLLALQDSPRLSATLEGEVVIEDIDVWVTSTNLTLFSPETGAGVQIAYPTITIHAQEGSAVLLGLNLSDSNTADEDLEFIQLRIIPPSIETHTPEDGSTEAPPQQPNGHSTSQASPAQALFQAISDCQELNPDRDPSEDGEEAFDETAPGATGWITSENMQDFVDENGEFRMPQDVTVVGAEAEGGGLGEGAGRARTAAEVDGDDGEDDPAKWQRTG